MCVPVLGWAFISSWIIQLLWIKCSARVPVRVRAGVCWAGKARPPGQNYPYTFPSHCFVPCTAICWLKWRTTFQLGRRDRSCTCEDRIHYHPNSHSSERKTETFEKSQTNTHKLRLHSEPTLDGRLNFTRGSTDVPKPCLHDLINFTQNA